MWLALYPKTLWSALLFSLVFLQEIFYCLSSCTQLWQYQSPFCCLPNPPFSSQGLTLDQLWINILTGAQQLDLLSELPFLFVISRTSQYLFSALCLLYIDHILLKFTINFVVDRMNGDCKQSNEKLACTSLSSVGWNENSLMCPTVLMGHSACAVLLSPELSEQETVTRKLYPCSLHRNHAHYLQQTEICEAPSWLNN